jgi:uncharacterized membrane protein YfcA
MTVTLVELAWVGVLGCITGSLGAITGIGGGIIIVPILVIVLGFDFATAVAASLAAVVATSTSAGSAYVAEGLTNMRLAITLEITTTIGGITGGFLGLALSEHVFSAIFAMAMLGVAFLILSGRSQHGDVPTDDSIPPPADIPVSTGLLDARYRDPDVGSKVVYRVRHVPLGMGASCGAGIVSGVLGVGGGFIKVPVMNLVMGVPIKVAVATSNFMIGVTALASLLVYLGQGEVHPAVLTPLVLGTIIGASVGVRLQRRISSHDLRVALAAVLVFVGLGMGLRAMGMGLG